MKIWEHSVEGVDRGTYRERCCAVYNAGWKSIPVCYFASVATFLNNRMGWPRTFCVYIHFSAYTKQWELRSAAILPIFHGNMKMFKL